MLICIAIPTLWTVLLQLKDKTAEVILAAIEKVITVFKLMRKKVTMIFVDGEAGVDSPKTKDRLFVKHDAMVDSSGKKRHTIQTLDRKTRTIKDHVRAIRSMVPFAVGGTMLLALFLQMTNIVNIMPTKGNNNGRSPFQAILGRNARLADICPHKSLETVLIAKHNDITNRTSNHNVIEAIFLFSSNINTVSKSKPEFNYLTVDTLEVITRGEGTPFRIKDFHIDNINRLSNAPNSILFCPSFQKAKAKRKQGRPRKEIKDSTEIRSPRTPQFTAEATTEVQIQAYEDFLTTTPRKNPREEGEDMSLGELLQSAPILGRKRAREVAPHVNRNIFQEEIAAGFLETGKIKTNDLVTVETDGGIQYQFFHKIDGKIQKDEPVYTACIDYLHLREGIEMFSFAAHTSINKALQLYPEVALQSLINEIEEIQYAGEESMERSFIRIFNQETVEGNPILIHDRQGKVQP